MKITSDGLYRRRATYLGSIRRAPAYCPFPGIAPKGRRRGTPDVTLGRVLVGAMSDRGIIADIVVTPQGGKLGHRTVTSH